MEIRFDLAEAKELSTEELKAVIEEMKTYTNKTHREAFLIVYDKDNSDSRMIVNTYFDVDVADNRMVEALHTYYYKSYIERNGLNISY